MRSENARDWPDAIENAPNVSLLRHQPAVARSVLPCGVRDRAASTGGPTSTRCNATHADPITIVSFQQPVLNPAVPLLPQNSIRRQVIDLAGLIPRQFPPYCHPLTPP